jgi:hypothetical protein
MLEGGHDRDAPTHRDPANRARLLRRNRAVMRVDVVDQFAGNEVVIARLRLARLRGVIAIGRRHDHDHLVLARHRREPRARHKGGVVLPPAVKEIQDRVALLRLGVIGW